MSVKSLRGSAPQSLTYPISDLSGLAGLHAYIKRICLEAVEVFDPQSLPMRSCRSSSVFIRLCASLSATFRWDL